MKELANSHLENLGIHSLNEMQHETQRAILKNENVLLLSPTGSGKTIAFLYPLIQLLEKDNKEIQCLIIVPTRELGLQIEEVWKKLKTNFKINFFYGGHSYKTELENLKNAPAVLIATPGRLAEHMGNGNINTTAIKYLILDEFDKTLHLNFSEQVSFIAENLTHLSKKIFVSATNSLSIPLFFNTKDLKEIDFITTEDIKDQLTTKFIYSDDKDKVEKLAHLICNLNSEEAIIFCNHREASERICEYLNNKGIFATFYHGGMDQDQRERVLIKFMNKSVRYLVTTDLASRGLDIPGIKHIIHYHLPAKEEEFIHRNGRTARMQNTGTIYILLHHQENLCEYLDYNSETIEVLRSNKKPNDPDYKTIYISGGKKNKISKTDIVGFFTQTGKITKDSIGRIDVKENISFVAIKSIETKNLLQQIKDQKMKGKKYKIEEARS